MSPRDSQLKSLEISLRPPEEKGKTPLIIPDFDLSPQQIQASVVFSKLSITVTYTSSNLNNVHGTVEHPGAISTPISSRGHIMYQQRAQTSYCERQEDPLVYSLLTGMPMCPLQTLTPGRTACSLGQIRRAVHRLGQMLISLCPVSAYTPPWRGDSAVLS